MSIWSSKDSQIPDNVDCAITDQDDYKASRIIATIALVEMTIDGAMGFPILQKLIAYTEMLYRLFRLQ